jgi:hypothetical protein
MGTPRSRLTRLQTEILAAFFHQEKALHGVVRGPTRSSTNKLCALLGRSEVRDLVDVRALEGLGLSLTEALAAGQRKDGA